MSRIIFNDLNNKMTWKYGFLPCSHTAIYMWMEKLLPKEQIRHGIIIISNGNQLQSINGVIVIVITIANLSVKISVDYHHNYIMKYIT